MAFSGVFGALHHISGSVCFGARFMRATLWWHHNRIRRAGGSFDWAFCLEDRSHCGYDDDRWEA